MRFKDVVRLGLAVAASWVGTTFQAHGQVLLEEVTTLSNAAPSIERSFDATPAGAYEVRLTDNAFPAAFVSLRLIVTRGSQIVATVDAPGSTAVPFNATAGTHVVHVVGQPNVNARAGTFAVDVRPVSSATPTLLFAEGMSLPPATPPNPNQLALQTKFTVSDAGAYQVEVSDLALPVPLSSVLLNIVGPGGQPVFVPPSTPPAAPGTYQFNASAGEHDLFVIAEAPASAAAGLIGVRISGGPSAAAVYDQAHAVGSLDAPAAISLGAGGAHTLRTTDFSFPNALTQLTAIVTRGGVSLARRDTPGSAAFNAAAGVAQLFVLGTPTAGGSGTYGVEVLSGATPMHQDVRAVNPSTGGTPAFTYAVDLATAGTYRVTLTDFQFAAALQTLALNVSQAGNSLGTLNAAAPLDVNAAVGRLFISVIAQPPNPNTSSLFGLQVAPTGGSPILGVTQGVGELFASRTVTVATAGRYDVTLNDLGFPATLADLALAVTRGSNRVGSIFGGGTFSFDATPGEYAINFIATPSATQKAGTYGLRVAPTPPAPTVTLTANPASVPNGATTMLTWNSTNATACTASGAWSGSKATSGSQASGALTSSSTFALTCNGAGGNANQSVTVTIAPPASGGGAGGGSLGILSLWALLTVLATRNVNRRYA